MKYQNIETERLVLRFLNQTYAKQVLTFLEENKENYARYEAEKKPMYYTRIYQEYVLQNEYEASMKKSYLRYYIFEKDSEEERVIGTVSVGQLRGYPYCNGVLGYKMAADKQNQGYGTEAVKAVCEVACSYLGLHRLEAYTMMDNVSSMRLLEKCGFIQEGRCIKNLKVDGLWQDHYLYGKILDKSKL